MSKLTFGVLTVSDTCSKDVTKDKSGPKLVELIKQTYGSTSIKTDVVPDDKSAIKCVLKMWTEESVHVIMTTGGTGFATRDVTPEATQEVIDRNASGLTIAMMIKGLQSTALASLSRSVCGIAAKTLIVNFPGKLKAVVECFDSVKAAIPHAIALLHDDLPLVRDVHDDVTLEAVPPKKSKVTIAPSADRVRESPYPMIEVGEALEIIAAKVACTNEHEIISIEQSLGRILAENVFSVDPFPPFRASIKDGYAIKMNYRSGAYYCILHTLNAGDELSDSLVLKPGEAIRISTGAPVPQSADAVVQIEDTKGKNEGDVEVGFTLTCSVKPGQDIREIGSDVPENELILQKGIVIDVGTIGVLATVGKQFVKVCNPRPSIGILSTGNELQDYKEPLKKYHIPDTNKITLMTLLKKYGFEATDYGIVKDNADALKTAFEEIFEHNDVLITTGGVSMGEYDLVKNVLQTDFNANIHFGRINMKPGKPTTFATCVYNGAYKLIFALPGNPVSAVVTTYLFVLPALRTFANDPSPSLPTIQVTYDDRDYPLDSRPEYVRARVIDNKAYLVGNQISCRINSLAGANALLKFPPRSNAVSSIKNDMIVDAILLN